ncbi:hypothetical protein FOA43_000301 [Brettanomyces nanus]|uniref:Symplekin/Pta1 N-terminal domain-containing protein n=1 Tax=Eeniella nana TaxID=13502 RepID=A0A875RSZ3_EENNA|nr:uncharacterized protein FOA43_000301 [Brettanomyces nanus]QPG72997.1 hypothetical protein FOA43_000301 [Brettanomyces nanus]
MSSSVPTEEHLNAQTHQIEEATKLAFDDSKYFDQVLDTIATISISQPIDNYIIQSHCLEFVYQAYYLRKIQSFELRCNNSTKIIDMLSRLIMVEESDQVHNRLPKYKITERCIEILSSTYDLMFYRFIDHPDKPLWATLCKTRDFVVSQWPSAYPLLSYNRDADWYRSISCKNATIRLIGKVIATHLPPASSSRDKKVKDMNDISIALVDKDHPFLYNSNIGSQGQALLDRLFSTVNDDILIPTAVFSAVVSVLMTLFRLRPNVVSSKFLSFILGYEAQLKRDPKFEADKLKLRMNRRFNDRLDKIIISLLLNRGFINKDPSLKARFENKLRYLVDKTAELRKKSILEDSEDDEDEDEVQRLRKRRKLADKDNKMHEPIDFYNECRIARANDYKSIYSLLKPGDALENFDMSTISPDMLSKMVIAALSKVDIQKLAKGLGLASDRYIEIMTRDDYMFAGNADLGDENEGDDTYDPSAVVKSESKIPSDDDDEDDVFSEEDVYSVPLPKTLDINQKKVQIKSIIDNFIRLASQNVDDNTDEPISGNNLSKVAISKWKSDSWIKILSRLATRGTILNEEISNYIREAIFEYFQVDIKDGLTGVIEWLNEEYYNESIKSEDAGNEETHTTYTHYTGKVLDTLIPFLDPSDRKVFIRLLSELPYLSKEMILKIRSVCADPARSKLGFQSVLYLMMFRPPLFQGCIDLLKEMYVEADNKNNEQLKNSCLKYLKKYAPKEIPATDGS